MIQPPFLKPGDTIAIAGLAKRVDRADIDLAVSIFEQWGLRVHLAPHLFDGHYRYSSTDEKRALDFQAALDNPEIKAIISARGGYGSMRLIERIDWSGLSKAPKWIVGFSDITAVLAHASRLNVRSIHGIMPAFFKQPGAENSIERLRSVLFGREESIAFPFYPLNEPGEAAAELVGGNLSLLCHIMGSVSDYAYRGKILFIEDIDEYLYRIDRMLLQLKRAGRLDGIKGLVVGHFTDMKDNEGDPFGKNVYEIIHEHFRPLNIPIAFGLPVGHDATNYPLVVGGYYRLIVNESGSMLAPK